MSYSILLSIFIIFSSCCMGSPEKNESNTKDIELLAQDLFGVKNKTPRQKTQDAISSLKKNQAVFGIEFQGKDITWIPVSIFNGFVYYTSFSIGSACAFPIMGTHSYLAGVFLAGLSKKFIDSQYHSYFILPEVKGIESFFEQHIEQNERLNTADSIDFDKNELNKMPGLAHIKQQIGKIASKVKADKMRKAAGLPTVDSTYHMMFTGNSGTGKTVTANAMAHILFKMGVIREDKCTLADKSSFYSNIIGSSAQRTENVMNEASGGVLFVDEAYSLNKKEINLNGEQVGSDVIEKLLSLLEDRSDDVVAIFAGYPDAMKIFKLSNPGLASRIPFTIEFANYTSDELFQIFAFFCETNDYALSDGADNIAKQLLSEIKDEQGELFANGRAVRNFFQLAVLAQAERLNSDNASSELAKEDLIEIQATDLQKAFEQRERVNENQPYPTMYL